MSKSFQEVVSMGIELTIPISFNYLAPTDVYLRIGDAEIPRTGHSTYTWSIVNNSVVLRPAVPAGLVVRVYRRTASAEVLNVYSQGASFTESSMDENFTQTLYLSQEYMEQGLPSMEQEFRTQFNKNEAEFRAWIQAKGWNPVAGSFEAGGTIVNSRDILWWGAAKAWYSWHGTLPKVVPAGSTPLTAGGVSPTAWVDLTDGELRNDLAADGGADLVFYKLANALSVAFNIGNYIDQSPIYPDLQFGADNTGVSDATSKLQAIIDAYPLATIVINGTYLFSRLNLQGFKGVINGSGTLKATGTQDIGLYFGDANGVVFDGPWLDMSHTATTTTETRCRYGFYLRDARNCRITPKVKNVRRGYPYWIDGTSSAAGTGKLDSWGSKDIYIVNPTIMAFPDAPDQGAQCIVKSDYYKGDGSTYISGGNGVKASDYTVDMSVSYPATTERVFLLGGYYENCDRIGVLNAKHVYETNSILNGMGKRGFNIAPTCNNVHLHGGSVRGGISAVINFTLGCTQCSAGGKFIDPQGYDSLSGEATALRVFQGCRDIAFYDIRGKGGALRSIWIIGCSDITVDNVKLDTNVHSTTDNCVEINAGLGGNDNSWVVSGIRIRNSQFTGKYAYAQNMTTGTATYAEDAIRLRNVIFFETVAATRAMFLAAPAVQNTFSIVNCEFATYTYTTLNPVVHSKANKGNTYAGNYLASSFADSKITTDTLPDDCPMGVTQTIINGTTSAPDTNNQGILETMKGTLNTGFRKFIVQRYYPANNAGTEYKTFYIRRGLKDSNAWSAWATVNGA